LLAARTDALPVLQHSVGAKCENMSLTVEPSESAGVTLQADDLLVKLYAAPVWSTRGIRNWKIQISVIWSRCFHKCRRDQILTSQFMDWTWLFPL